MNENKPGWKYKTLEFQPKTYMLKYRVDQQLIVLNLNFASINRILVTVIKTVKVSQNLNSMQKISNQISQ